MSNAAPNTYVTDLRIVTEDGKKTICAFHHLSKEYSETFDRDTPEANARLIASAPELLEALKRLLITNPLSPAYSEAEKHAEDIIKKATGIVPV
jgi:hypothetical protein